MWSFPFVRMVAVCGSQAMDNGDEGGDIDIFLIGERDRMWLVQCAAMVLRRFYGVGGSRICPNYFLSIGDLLVERRDFYHAHEIFQTVPLRGGGLHRRFLEVNGWTRRLLPNLDPDSRRARLVESPPGRARRRWERLLAGRIGDVMDTVVHRLLLVYYPLRLWRRGWSRETFRRTYRRERQEVMTGGFAPAVRAAFRREAERRLGPGLTAEVLPPLFPDAEAREHLADPHFSQLFTSRYGAPSDHSSPPPGHG